MIVQATFHFYGKDSITIARKSGNILFAYWKERIRFVFVQHFIADRIKQYLPTSIRKKSTTLREQPPRMYKGYIAKIKCDSGIGQHLLQNPDCAKTYTDDNFRIIGQVRSSFHLSVLESVYIKTQNPVLCKQKEFVFSLGLFN